MASANAAAFPLPGELIALVCSNLANSDIKSLRLACSLIANFAWPRINRVFLSAHRLDLNVFTSIAQDDRFRSMVTEIIYDDALLPSAGRKSNHPKEALLCVPAELDGEDPSIVGCPDQEQPPWWFYDTIIADLDDTLAAAWHTIYHRPAESTSRTPQSDGDTWEWKGEDEIAHGELSSNLAEFVETQFDPPGYGLYRRLIREQREILESGRCREALETGLRNFPHLRKITVTAATHGRSLNPLYLTPSIREFPRLYQYPLPRGWHSTKLIDGHAPEWQENGTDWVGFCHVVEALAENKDEGRVVELAIDAHHLKSGLNVTMFDKDCPALSNFKTVLARPNLRHLKLDLLVDGDESRDWETTRNGQIRDALSRCAGLESLDFFTSACDFYGRDQADPTCHVPLQTIFPVDCLAKLRHFGLTRFWVKEDDVMELLRSLPSTLQTIELSFLLFLQGSYHGLLEQLKQENIWLQNDSRLPRFIIGVPKGELDKNLPGMTWQVDVEVNAFLYEDGRNPFMPLDPDLYRDQGYELQEGVGVCKDIFGAYLPLEETRKYAEESESL